MNKLEQLKKLKKIDEIESSLDEKAIKPKGVYYAKDYGIIGDNVTCVSDKMQSLVDLINKNGGGVIQLEFGRYVFTKDVVWKSLVSLKGVGVGRTILAPKGGGEFTPINFFSPTVEPFTNEENPYMYCDFENFEIDGSGYTRSTMTVNCKGIFLQYLRQCNFKDLYIHDTIGTGLGVDFLGDCIIHNVRTYNCGRLWTSGGMGQSGIGIGTGGMKDEKLVISDCICKKSGQFGIFIENQFFSADPDVPPLEIGYPKNITIHDCIVSDGRKDGINIRSGKNIIIHDCISENNAKEGISVSFDVYDTIIHDCISRGNAYNGIAVECYDAKNVSIHNNKCYDNIFDGIYIQCVSSGVATYMNDASFTIKNNECYGNQKFGIRNNTNIKDSVFSYNNIFNNGLSGIIMNGIINNLEMCGNLVYNNNTKHDVVYIEGIRLEGSVTNFKFSNNTIFDNTVSKNQKRGFVQGGTSTINFGFVKNNFIYNHTINYLLRSNNSNLESDVINTLNFGGNGMFNGNSYAKMPNSLGELSTITTFAMEFSFVLSNESSKTIISRFDESYSGTSGFAKGWAIRTGSTGKLIIEAYADNVGVPQLIKASATNLSRDVRYWARMSYDGVFKMSLSTDGINYTNETLTGSSDTDVLNAMKISFDSSTYFGQAWSGNAGYINRFKGSIYNIKIWKNSVDFDTIPTHCYNFNNYGVNRGVIDNCLGSNGQGYGGLDQGLL